MSAEGQPPAGAGAGRRPLVAVLAVARNGVIGRDNALPWRMPSDLARFRALTMGKPMIMGRRTFEAIGRPLPGRDSIVVSRGAPALPAGVHPAASPDEAVELADGLAAARGASAVCLIGGATLFAALLGRARRLHLTVVDLQLPGDTRMGWPDPFEWRETGRHRPPRHPADEAACVFVDYERI